MKYWRWDKVDDYEYRLKDENHQIKGYLIQDGSGDWVVRFFNDDIDGAFPNTARLKDMDNAEHAIWQATLWIYNQCNKIANSFHHIRNHLPSIHELAEEYRKPIGEETL